MLKIIKKERKELLPIFNHDSNDIFESIGIPELPLRLKNSSDLYFKNVESSKSKFIEKLMNLDKIELAFLLASSVEEVLKKNKN